MYICMYGDRGVDRPHIIAPEHCNVRIAAAGPAAAGPPISALTGAAGLKQRRGVKLPIPSVSILSCCTAAGLLVAADPASAAPKTARVHVQAPVDLQNPGATRLDAIEGYGSTPLLYRSFEVPYATLEALIDGQLDAIVPNKLEGVEVCTDPCPDVTWSIRISPTFKFTQKNQPTLTAIGSSSQNKVKIELRTQARLDVHADVRAETWFDTVEVPVDIYVVVGLKAAVELELWPVIKVHKPGSSEPGVALEFTLDDKNIDLELNGTAAALGGKWGTIVGLSPAGLLVGGPILGVILAVIGDEAADLAEAAISDVFYARVEAMLNGQGAALEDMVNDYIDPVVDQANAVKDKLMATKLPGVGKTITELQTTLGAKLELHTTTPDGGVASSGVLRLSAAAGAGKLKGVVRLPKQTCEYAKINGGPLKGATIPLGLVAANNDLAAKVGQACATAMGGGLTTKGYLGANPRRVLGPSAQDLPSWKDNVGQMKWTGNVTQTDKWYECAFEVASLPNAGIVRLDGQPWLAQHLVDVADRRYFEAKLGAQIVLDNLMKPVPNGQLVFGGEGKCGGGGGGAGLAPSKLKELKDMLDPAKCPQCGVMRKPGMEHVIEVNNSKGFLDTAIGKQVLQNVQTARAPAAPKVKPGAAKPGM